MSWEIFTTEDAISQFTQAETAAIRNLQGSGSGWGSGSGTQYANVDIIVAKVIDEVRGYIIAGDYDVDLTDDRTLPLALFDDAIAIARWRILISTPSFRQLQTEERRLAFEIALKKLQLIADQKFTVEPPIAGVTPRTGNWNSENKLLMRTHPVPPPESQFPPISTEWANQGFASQPVYIAGALYVPTITALRDSATSLEAYPSARYPTGTGLMIVIDLSVSTWQFVSGPADEDNPDGEVQPLDYNVGTNNRHWAKVGGL